MITDNDPLVLSEYNSQWAELYNEEEVLLKQALSNRHSAIEHIGSTAVPGLAAKPVIDILISVPKSDHQSIATKLEALGYKQKTPDFGNSPLFYCKNSGNKHTHHLHIVEPGSQEEAKHIWLRDYLRANPRGAQEYEALKKAMAEKFSNDRSAYVDAKTAFITLALALHKPNPA